MVPAKPPQPTADAESFATSQMLGLGLSGAVLPGNVLRSVCEQCRVFWDVMLSRQCASSIVVGTRTLHQLQRYRLMGFLWQTAVESDEYHIWRWSNG
jgi:hypothetical protein